jgi:hypothetical protein
MFSPLFLLLTTLFRLVAKEMGGGAHDTSQRMHICTLLETAGMNAV